MPNTIYTTINANDPIQMEAYKEHSIEAALNLMRALLMQKTPRAISFLSNRRIERAVQQMTKQTF